MSSIGLPFRRMSAQQWLNIVWVLLALFYVFFVVGTVSYRGLFDYLGADYRAFLSSAEIASSEGFGRIYDLDVQGRFQRAICATYAGPAPLPCETAPLFYLAIFVLPFLPFLLLPPLAGFVAWTLLNAVVLVLYLRRFLNALGEHDRGDILYKALLSAPAFATLFFGQVSIWLLVFLGEFLLASRQRKEFVGGLWLAGLLLKPQLLLLLVPALLIGRRFKALAGFALAGLAIVGLSTLLVGIPVMVDFGRLLVRSSGDMATTNPQVMMNWRALAVNLAPVLPASLAENLAYAGMGLTAALGLSLWFRPFAASSAQFAIAALGTYAATCAVTWHAHTNSAFPTLALLLFACSGGSLPRRTVDLWLVIPAVVFPVAFFAVPALAHNLAGLSLFALNLYLVAWAAWKIWKASPTGVADSRPGVA